MAKFNFYRYSFEPIEQPVQSNIIVKERLTLEEANIQKSELLWKILLDDENIKTFLGSRKKYSTKTLSRDNNIYVSLFANKKIHGYELAFNRDHRQQEEPSCVVMLDNREGMQYIAIEKRTVAFANTDIVAKSIQKTLNRYLEPYRLCINVRGQYRKDLFWSVVDSHPEGIKSIRFNFPYPNMPEWTENYDDYEAEWMKRYQGSLSRQYTGLHGEALILKRGDANLERWNTICEESAMPIDIQPLRGRIVHCNAKVSGSQIVEFMDDRHLECIINDTTKNDLTPFDRVALFMNNHKRNKDE